jgi:uncharacterized protein (TIGR02466 family)
MSDLNKPIWFNKQKKEMKNNDVVVFPTLLNLVEDFLTENQCNDIIKFARKKKYKQHEAMAGDAISNHGLEDTIISDIKNNVKNCKDIENNLFIFINEYLNKVALRPVKLTNSWVNFQKKGSTLYPHTHPGNSISGVIYLKVDDNSSHIAFHNPNPFSSFMNKKGQSYFNYDFQDIKPKTGCLIIFPSWLQHSSGLSVNQSEERVALSFNAR